MANRIQSAIYSCLCVFLVLTTCKVSGQQCDLDLQANSSFVEQDAVQGSGSCTWTITVETEHDKLLKFTMVNVVFDSVNLTSREVCDPTNSIVVYDGDTTARVLGLVCGNNLTFTEYQSSGNVLTLQYPANQLSDVYSFRIKYKYELIHRCSSFATAVSETEYSLVTPRYPSGDTMFAIDCSWKIMPATNNKRIRINIEATTSDCRDVNMTIYGNRFRKLGTWCPTNSSIFQSFEGMLLLDFDLANGTALKVTYKLLDESPCKGTINATTAEQFLTTPNYPEPYPRYTECQWDVISRDRENGSLRIEVLDLDIDDTPNCTAESLVIKRDRYEDGVVMHKLCSGTHSFYQYDYKTVIVFKSWKTANTNKGIKIKVYRGEAEPCGGELVATSTPQKIISPGYPYVYPNSVNCVWNITPSDPHNNVKIKFLEIDISKAFGSCGRDYLRFFDGSSTFSRLLAEVCSSGVSDLQGTEGPMTVLFKTDDSYSKKGFVMSYEEASDSSPVFKRVDATYKDGTITSPRYPDGQVRNLNMTWQMESRFISSAFLVTFNDVNMGDDCTNNYIKVYQGNTSSSKSTTLCGTDSEIFMGRDMAVVLKTGDNLNEVGFRANHETLYSSKFEGCLGTAHTESAYSVSKDFIQTPNYPNRYPNYAECNYMAEGALDDYRVRVFIEDVDFGGDEECNKDYFEIFDGRNKTAKSWGRFCRNSTQVFESTGRYVLITFTSDGKHSGRGGRVAVQGIMNLTETGTSYLWVVILVCVLGGLVIVGFVIFYVVKKKRQGSAPL